MRPYRKLYTRKEIKERYSKEALVYDKTRFGCPGGKYVDEVEKGTIAKFLKGDSVLELGTGTARYGIFLRKRGYNFVGADIAPGMLKAAKEKVKMEGLDVEFIQMDAENLAFHEKFDNVICIHTFNAFSRPLRFLNQAYDALKPGGRCVVSFELDNFWVRLLLKTRIVHEPASVKIYYSNDEVPRLLRKAGFKVIGERRLFHFPMGFYPLSPRFVIELVKKFDDKIGGGMLSIVVGEKP